MRAILLISMSTLIAAATAGSQPISLLPPGTRVRLSAQSNQEGRSPSDGRIGSVILAGPDSLRIRFSGVDSASTFPWGAIRSLEVSRPGSRVERAKTGAVVGGLAGAAIGAAVGAGKDGRREFLDPAFTGALEGFAYGAVAGAAIGAATTSERWERVWPQLAFRAARPPMRRSSFRTTPTFARP